MRLSYLLLPALFAGCGPVATQRAILERSKIEVSRREAWSDVAFIKVEQKPDDFRFTWEVLAGAFDYERYPKRHGIHLIPGTERSLRFTRDGCLIEYADNSGRCAQDYNSAVAPAPTGCVEPLK